MEVVETFIAKTVLAKSVVYSHQKLVHNFGIVRLRNTLGTIAGIHRDRIRILLNECEIPLIIKKNLIKN